MQNVSREYKESMRNYDRNKGYIKATIGIINSDAQKKIEINPLKNNLLYISNTKSVFDGDIPEQIYAFPEEGFSKLDGSMRFPPPKNSSDYELYNNGVVSDEILGSIYIDFDGEEFDIKGLSIDFGEAYPIEFQIETNNTIKSYAENDKRNWNTEDSFDGTKFFKITPITMVNGQGRLRIYQFSCGIVNTFTNADVINYSCTEYVSPIAESLPSTDVSLSVKNYDMYYNPDNPESAFAYMDVRQEVKISLGYDVNGKGKIEWLPERKAYLKTWKATETQADFTATDLFDNISGIYYKGRFYENGITLYDLALDVLEDAGITDYFIDTYLKKVTVRNPIPPIGHSSALQIIANAARCTLREDRSGKVIIQSSFVPEMTVSANNEAWYSHSENLLNSDIKAGYANTSNGFSVLDGSILFIPKEEGNLFETGYISESIWMEKEEKEVNQRLSFRLGNDLKAFPTGGYWKGIMPIITINLESTYTAFGIGINFRNVVPQEFSITAYREDEITDYVVFENPNVNFFDNHAFVDFDKIEIRFIKGHPNSRIFVDNIVIGDNTDYELRRNVELMDAPVTTKQDKLKETVVSINSYRESTELKEVVSEEMIVEESEYIHTVYLSNPSYGLSVIVENGNATAEIIESSNYYAKIKFTGTTALQTIKYSVFGYEYIQEEQKYIKEHNPKGQSITWNNPLIGDISHASLIEEWISDYFIGDVDYEINWRGDPSVDANDLFNLETKIGKRYVRSYENTLTFNAGWQGRMKARKVAK